MNEVEGEEKKDKVGAFFGSEYFWDVRAEMRKRGGGGGRRGVMYGRKDPPKSTTHKARSDQITPKDTPQVFFATWF